MEGAVADDEGSGKSLTEMNLVYADIPQVAS